MGDGWMVAHTHIHLAFDALGAAERACHLCQPYSPEQHSWPECLRVAGKVEALREEELRMLLIAVALFQAGMEALISHSYSLPPLSGVRVPRGFVSRWTTALTHVGSVHNFATYATFYEDYRNAIIHPDSPAKIKLINDLNFGITHRGVNAGWLAFAELSNLCGQPHTPDSWRTMCESHRVTSDINANPVPSTAMMAAALFKKHLDGARAAQEA